MLALWAGSAPKGASGNADSLPGKSQLLCLGLVSCPRANSFCRDAGGGGKQQASHGNTHHSKSMFWCFIHACPPPAPSLSFCFTQSSPA